MKIKVEYKLGDRVLVNCNGGHTREGTLVAREDVHDCFCVMSEASIPGGWGCKTYFDWQVLMIRHAYTKMISESDYNSKVFLFGYFLPADKIISKVVSELNPLELVIGIINDELNN